MRPTPTLLATIAGAITLLAPTGNLSAQEKAPARARYEVRFQYQAFL